MDCASLRSREVAAPPGRCGDADTLAARACRQAVGKITVLSAQRGGFTKWRSKPRATRRSQASMTCAGIGQATWKPSAG